MTFVMILTFGGQAGAMQASVVSEEVGSVIYDVIWQS